MRFFPVMPQLHSVQRAVTSSIIPPREQLAFVLLTRALQLLVPLVGCRSVAERDKLTRPHTEAGIAILPELLLLNRAIDRPRRGDKSIDDFLRPTRGEQPLHPGLLPPDHHGQPQLRGDPSLRCLSQLVIR